MDADPELVAREHLFGPDVRPMLARVLGETNKPTELVPFIQHKFGLKEPASGPILPLLDLLGVSRGEVHAYILNQLLADLRERLSSLQSREQLEPFLAQTFPYINIEELKSVPIAILERIPRIPDNFLRTLASLDYRSTYRELPIAVKRQVWEASEGAALFREHVLPIVDAYAAEAAAARAHLELLNPPGPPRKRRAGSEALGRLCEAVGSSGALYERVLGLLRQRHAEGGNRALCTLRSDLVMAAHDAGNAALYERDGCHKLAWCLDACLGLKEGLLDERQVREIEAFLAACPREALPDAALVLRDPHVEHALVRNVLAGLHECARRAALPRHSTRLVHVTRLLAIGARAAPNFKAPDRERDPVRAPPDPTLLNELYPALVGALVDSAVARAERAGPDGTVDRTEARRIDLGPPPEALAALVAASGTARTVAGALALAALRRADVPLFLYLAPLLAAPAGEAPRWASEEAACYGYSLATELSAPGPAFRPAPAPQDGGGGEEEVEERRRGRWVERLLAGPPAPPGPRLLADSRVRAAAIDRTLLPLARACALGHEALLRLLLPAATMQARAGGPAVRDADLLAYLRAACEGGRLADPVGSGARAWGCGAGATSGRAVLAAYGLLLKSAPERLNERSAGFVFSYITSKASLVPPAP